MALPLKEVSYFPGCSLATTAKENNHSMLELCRKIGVNLVEIKDWNCCGSSSTPSLNEELAFSLGVRNISLAPKGIPLLVACPNCNIRLRQSLHKLKQDEEKRLRYEEKWGRTIDPDLEIINFFDLIDGIDLLDFSKDRGKRLHGLKFVPYYGCMLAQPSKLEEYKNNYYGAMGKILSSLGGESLSWSYSSRCCGTYLSVAKPDLITSVVNEIVKGAINAGADCIVTACSMCHLNLEVRCSLKTKIPTMHFSELLSLSLGTESHEKWFAKHLVDPKPIFQCAGII